MVVAECNVVIVFLSSTAQIYVVVGGDGITENQTEPVCGGLGQIFQILVLQGFVSSHFGKSSISRAHHSYDTYLWIFLPGRHA